MGQQRIMIVEDEHIVALDIRKQIEHQGYAVASIHSSGEAALEAIPESRPDLVLMDIRLQGELDGLETARIIKSRHRLPVIMLTAYADDATLHRAKLAEPFAYIIKPFEERELRTAIIMSLYRHEMEQLVVERERLFATTLESIIDAVIVTDSEGRIEFLNSVACDMLGLHREESIGTVFEDQVAFSDREDPGAVSGVSPAVAPGAAEAGQETGSGKREMDVRRADGRVIPVDRTVSPLGEAETGGRVWVLHDISGRIEAERLLRAQNKRMQTSRRMEAIGRLTGGIAHDFNNLLTVIMGYSRLIVDELGDSSVAGREAIVNDVEGIRTAAMRSAALTRQMLDFSRSTTVERRAVDLDLVLVGMDGIFSQLLKDDVKLSVDTSGKGKTVYADPSQLEQVILNLVVNARDAMPDGGRLLVRTETRHVGLSDVIGRDNVEPGDFVALTVSDSGGGMTAETLERVFDPFFTTKETGEGTGLGLSTVYSIAAGSGGFVEVESEVDKGTRFTVFLPVHTSEDAADQGPLESPAPDTGGETVLVVEDEEAIRQLVARLLRKKGYEVLEASNAGEALLQAEDFSGTIHLLLSDVVMPFMSGMKLAARLRETRPDLRVVLMSGYPDTSVSEAERQEAGFHFLQKPIDPGTLTGSIRQILDG